MRNGTIDELILQLRKIKHTRKGIEKDVYSKEDVDLYLAAGPVNIFPAEDLLYPQSEHDVNDFTTFNRTWLQGAAQLLLKRSHQYGGPGCYKDHWDAIINGSYFARIRQKL